MAMRIYVDFNTITADPPDRVHINTCLDPTLVQKLTSRVNRDAV